MGDLFYTYIEKIEKEERDRERNRKVSQKSLATIYEESLSKKKNLISDKAAMFNHSNQRGDE